MLGQPADESIALYEVMALIVLIFLAAIKLRPDRTVFRMLSASLRAIANRPWIACLVCGIAAVVCAVGLAMLTWFPQPSVHDEFSFLLAADTFAQGRMTNPTHPMWRHFESFHIIQQPSYASKYPPAQGVLLAVGQFIGGHPIVGVWIGAGLASATLCWMLQAFVPKTWAFYGALLAGFHRGIVAQWAHSYSGGAYWGGTTAFLGGALLYGGMRRIIAQPKWSSAIAFSLGLVVLANSRPFEGLIASIPACVVLLIHFGRQPFAKLPQYTAKLVLPAACCLGLAALAMGLFNWQVTGNPFRLPYQVHEATYGVVPLFLWESKKEEPRFVHEPLRQLHASWEASWYESQQSLRGLVQAYVLVKLHRFWEFYLGITLPVLLIGLPWAICDRWVQFALVTLGLLLTACIGATYFQPHYVAPITSLIVLTLVQSVRYLRTFRFDGRYVGRFLVRGAVLIYLVSFAISFANRQAYFARVADIDNPANWTESLSHPSGFESRIRLSMLRQRLIEQLESIGGRHLVIVRHEPWFHPVDFEFVYNEADIDNASVVWARELDSRQNRELLEYFRDRRVWLLEAEAVRPELVGYRIHPDTTSASLSQYDRVELGSVHSSHETGIDTYP